MSVVLGIVIVIGLFVAHDMWAAHVNGKVRRHAIDAAVAAAESGKLGAPNEARDTLVEAFKELEGEFPDRRD